MRLTESHVLNRLISMFFDHMIMSFITLLFEAPVMISRMMAFTHHTGPLPLTPFFGIGIYDVIAFSLYFNKDIYLGQSIAKRILGYQVLNNKTGLPAGPFRCLVRNFSLPLWPIEVIVTIAANGRRIGDYIAGTRVGIAASQAQFPDTAQKLRPNWPAMIACVPLAGCFLYVVYIYPLELLMQFTFTHLAK